MSSFAAWRGRPSLLDAQWINLARPNLSAFLSVYALSAELMVPPSADFDENGVVDGHDLIVWQRGFGATPAGFADGDANGDDIVDHNDLAFWESHFGEAADVVVFAATPAPEPSTWLLTASAYMAVLVIRRRRGS